MTLLHFVSGQIQSKNMATKSMAILKVRRGERGTGHFVEQNRGLSNEPRKKPLVGWVIYGMKNYPVIKVII